jgi:hypothetical protein
MAVGSYEPRNTGDWQCVQCGLWYSAGIQMYYDNFGPICENCSGYNENEEAR